jgi:hypothetical protein
VTLPLAGFQKWRRFAGRFSKETCFSATYLPNFKTGEISPCWLLKAVCATPRILASNRV